MNAPAAPFAALPAVLPGIAAAAERHDREGSFPHGSLDALRDAGLLALAVPAAVGGGGAGLRVSALAVEAVGAACPATALVLGMQYLKHAALARSPAWPAALRVEVQRSAVEDGALINALRVEPELGSPTRGGLPATVARRTPNGWLLSGRKRYSTGLPALRWLEVWARTDEDALRVGTFLVPADAPGIEVVETWHHLGLRASGSHDAVFSCYHCPWRGLRRRSNAGHGSLIKPETTPPPVSTTSATAPMRGLSPGIRGSVVQFRAEVPSVDVRPLGARRASRPESAGRVRRG
jgi:alkylation response protein AidB-like acyl-CoA dehydrogenase